MEQTRAYKFRIYPDATRQNEIDERLILAQRFYNKLLEKTIQTYKDGNSRISMAQLNAFRREVMEEDNSYSKLYSQTRCEVEYRLLKAYQNFFRRIKEKREGKNVKAGFPRFKSIDRYKSITYPQNNGSFRILDSDLLSISGIGIMKFNYHREIVGKIKTMAIKKEGKEYYAIFTAVIDKETSIVEDTNPVGIDMGINNFIALSDGKTVQKPKFFKQEEKRIVRLQRKVSKKKKGSKRRQKAKIRFQRGWSKVTNKSNDFMHKLSYRLIHSGYTSFVIEKLHIDNMLKNHKLAQPIQNASWNHFIQMLSYKAESAGMTVVKVDAKNTTKECSECGNIQEMPLSAREYNCSECGMQMDRDINASINILKRGRAGHVRTNAQGDNRPYDEKPIASGVVELRTYPAT